MLRRIDRLILRVPALPSAVRYYRDVLGLKLLREEARIASFLMADGVTELVLRADPDQPAEEIYYLVDNVRDLYARREQLNLKFLQPPRQTARGYRAGVKDPFGNVLLLLDRSTESAGQSTVEDGALSAGLFSGIELPVPARREMLVKLYEQVGRTADDLPYTPHFETLYQGYSARLPEPRPTRREVWRHLLNLRKGGKLPRLGDARDQPQEIAEPAQQQLRDMLGPDIGKRDRLPYTDRFDKLVDQFNKTQARPLSAHVIWRLVAKLAK